MDSILIGVLSIIVMFGGTSISFGSGTVDSDNWISINAQIPAPTENLVNNLIDGEFVQAGVYADENSPTGYYYASLFLPDGTKGFIPAFIDIITNNPLIEIVTLLFLSGCSIAFIKKIIRT